MDQKLAGDSPEAKVYSAIKLRLTILSILLESALLGVWAFTSFSRELVNYIEFYYYNPYLQFTVFISVVGGSFLLLGLLLDLYGGYYIEHAFHLSTQTFTRWCLEHAKSLAVSIVIALPLSLLFFYLVRACGSSSYLVFATILFLFSVVLARIAPVILFPLFYRFTTLPEGDVRSRLSALLDKEKISFREIYSFNMSKNTRKANAALAGMGKSRRIILSDTLLSSFTPAEIEVIFAHEVGHYRHRHILTQVIVSGCAIYLSFFLCGISYTHTIAAMGFLHEYDIAALPILVLYLSLFGLLTMPLTNLLSRHFERQADAYA
ncbi:MAG TPA: M48 family metalloprotease, partial [Spirochaetota bacterium]